MPMVNNGRQRSCVRFILHNFFVPHINYTYFSDRLLPPSLLLDAVSLRLGGCLRTESKVKNFEHFKIFHFDLPVTHFANRCTFLSTFTTALSSQSSRWTHFCKFFKRREAGARCESSIIRAQRYTYGKTEMN